MEELINREPHEQRHGTEAGTGERGAAGGGKPQPRVLSNKPRAVYVSTTNKGENRKWEMDGSVNRRRMLVFRAAP
jgi:hypothetical protein